MVKPIIGVPSHSVVGASHFTWTQTQKVYGFAKSSSAYRLHFNKLRERLGSSFIKCLLCLWSDWETCFLYCCLSVSLQYETMWQLLFDRFEAWTMFWIFTAEPKEWSFFRSVLCVLDWLIILNATKTGRITIFSAQDTNMWGGFILGPLKWRNIIATVLEESWKDINGS